MTANQWPHPVSASPQESAQFEITELQMALDVAETLKFEAETELAAFRTKVDHQAEQMAKVRRGVCHCVARDAQRGFGKAISCEWAHSFVLFFLLCCSVLFRSFNFFLSQSIPSPPASK